MRAAFIEKLCNAAAKDDRIWLLTGDLGFSVLEPFIARFPERFINVGVAEQNMVGVAAGLAMSGKKAFVYSIANFAVVRCLEQIRNDICYHNLDVKLVSVGAGFAYGPAGYTHQGIEETHMLRVLPNIDIVIPADPVEAILAMDALLETSGPAYLKLGKAPDRVIHRVPPSFERGKAIVLREGGDGLLIAAGSILANALAAADLAASAGKRIAVWSAPWLTPMNPRQLIDAAKAYPVIATIEEARAHGGLGSAVAEIAAAIDVPRARIVRFGVPPELTWVIGSRDHLLKKACLMPEQILNVLSKTMGANFKKLVPDKDRC